MMGNDHRMNDDSAPRAHLQIFPQSLNLIQEEVQVALLQLRRKDDHAEKIDSTIQRLITDHHRATFHHAFLNKRRHLVERIGHCIIFDIY